MLVEGLLIGQLWFHPPNSESPSRWRRISGREEGGGTAGAKVAAATVEGITETSCEDGEISNLLDQRYLSGRDLLGSLEPQAY